MAQDALPIEDSLPELLGAIKERRCAVLQAPPGAGKTTRVPLALLESGLVRGRILMLEPRRLAARASADRMADSLGEPTGKTVGYRIRGDAKAGPQTRVEVITEGILTRRLQSDPELGDVGAIIFDEFHERSLQSDLGLALSLEVRDTLRPDLIIIVMSATLDTAPVANLMGNAPVVRSLGRAWPVETRWLDRPLARDVRRDTAAADLVVKALSETVGGVLVFLPGEGEIRRVARLLSGRIAEDCVVHPLYGALPFADQRRAIAPADSGRKIVLSTAIAETSLTIQDVRVVVDCGMARRSRYSPGSGMSRLVTERVTRAEAEQRRGRAGRVAEGVCYRLWFKGEEGALAAHPPAEIEAADLSGLALELALWGTAPEDLAFLTPPPAQALERARSLLVQLDALDAAGRITTHGQHLARLPLHPRLAHMLTRAGPAAANLAALLNDRDPLRGSGTDLSLRTRALSGGATTAGSEGALRRMRSEAARLRKLAPADHLSLSEAEMVALAYPDRIGLRRPGDEARWLLSGGKGAKMDSGDALAGARLIVAADLDEDKGEARVRLASVVSESELRTLFASAMETVHVCQWSRRDRKVIAREQERLGAVVLSDSIWRDAAPDARRAAAHEGLRILGLGALKPSESFRLLRARLALARTIQPELPDPSEPALLESAEDWLADVLPTVTCEADFRRIDPYPAFVASLSWSDTQTLDKITPPVYRTPLGRKIPIDYSGEAPEVRLRLQEVFGETRHPKVGNAPLRLTLLSPAGRPVQTTTDLPGFWHGSYADVRKDMRARYPKHPWPEDPTQTAPTLRAKPRSR